MPLSEVPDPVFAGKMAGDGAAIMITGDTVVAPADGELSLVFKTKHAFAMTLENGLEILSELINSKNDDYKSIIEKMRGYMAEELSERGGIPKTLSELGVENPDFETLAENSMKDACAGANPVFFDKELLIKLFKKIA